MPKGNIGRLIVRLHEDIEGCGEDDTCGPDCRKIVWKNGAHLRKDGCRARIRFINDREQGREIIKIEVQGAAAEDRKPVLRDIRKELKTIHRESFPSLRFFEKIPCCCEECRLSLTPHEYDMADLKRMKGKGKKDIRCMISGNDVFICQLEDGVFPNMERPLKEQENSAQPAVVIHNHLPQSADPDKKPWLLRWCAWLAGAITLLAGLAEMTGFSLSDIYSRLK